MLFGAHLARTGVDVTLVGTWRLGLEALAADGVRVEDDRGGWRAPVAVAEAGSALVPAPLTLVLVKSYRTAAVAPWVSSATAPGGLVVTLQNGLGNVETLARAGAAVVVGVTSVGAAVASPGTVRPGGTGPTFLGPGPTGDATDDLSTLFSRAGLETRATDDIAPHRWRKLAVNCAINPLTAIHGCVNGRLLAAPDTRSTLVATAREVASVAAARGVTVGDTGPLVLNVARRTARNRSSMLQDLDRGAPTEIDALNGAVVELARRQRVEVPVNRSLLRKVRALTPPSESAGNGRRHAATLGGTY